MVKVLIGTFVIFVVSTILITHISEDIAIRTTNKDLQSTVQTQNKAIEQYKLDIANAKKSIELKSKDIDDETTDVISSINSKLHEDNSTDNQLCLTKELYEKFCSIK